MKKSKIFLLSGIIMYLIAVIFVFIALFNPNLSWNMSTSYLRIIYLGYAIVNLALFALFGIFSIKKAKAEQNGFMGTIISLAVISALALPLYYFVSIAPIICVG